jgi:hypothetical protein
MHVLKIRFSAITKGLIPESPPDSLIPVRLQQPGNNRCLTFAQSHQTLPDHLKPYLT